MTEMDFVTRKLRKSYVLFILQQTLTTLSEAFSLRKEKQLQEGSIHQISFIWSKENDRDFSIAYGRNKIKYSVNLFFICPQRSEIQYFTNLCPSPAIKAMH